MSFQTQNDMLYNEVTQTLGIYKEYLKNSITYAEIRYLTPNLYTKRISLLKYFRICSIFVSLVQEYTSRPPNF